VGQYLDIAKTVEARLPRGLREESAMGVQEPPATAPRTHATCPHPAYFPPIPTDGPTRQCRHCPHVWQVSGACGAASWTPTAHWGVDGAGTVVWTCRGCGLIYAPGTAGYEGFEATHSVVANREA